MSVISCIYSNMVTIEYLDLENVRGMDQRVKDHGLGIWIVIPQLSFHRK